MDRVNHNLNTSESYYGQICSTHTYEDRLATLAAVRSAGIELCSGGILGMGESQDDEVRMAFALRDLGVESIPVNFLNPIDGTPLEGVRRLNPRYVSKRGHVSLRESQPRIADRRGPRTAPAQPARWDCTRPTRFSSAII